MFIIFKVMFGRDVKYKLDNEFGSFTVEELIYEGRLARVLFSGPEHAAQSGIPLDGNPRMLFDYNQRFVELALELKPNNILVLGGGALTLPMALIDRLEKSFVTTVEINKDLIEVAKSYFNYLPNKRHKIIIADADDFVKANINKYDLIFIDLYNDFVTPERFRIIGFAQLINNLLAKHSVLAINCISGLYGDYALPAKQLYSIYSKAVGPIRIIQADANYYQWLQQNLIIIVLKNKQLDEHWFSGYKEVSSIGVD